MNVPIFIVMLLLAIPCVVENVVVLLIIITDRKLHTVTNILIVSMAIADFAVGAINMPLYVNELSSETLKYVECMVSKSVTLIFILLSIFHLFLIALDRFIAIVYPLRYELLMTPRRVLAMVISLWIAIPIAGMLPLMGWRSQEYTDFNEPLELCYFGAFASLSYTMVMFFLCCLVPVVTMMVLYCCIFRVAKQQARRIADVQQNFTDRQEYRASKKQQRKLVDDSKAAKVLCLVMGCFLISMLPASICLVIDIITLGGIPNSVAVFTNFFAFSNSIVNPLIYALGTKQTRLAIQRRLARYCRCMAVRQAMDERDQTISCVSNNVPSIKVVVENIEGTRWE
ncbi:adenosine receptor A3-like [Ptychodera flava]|uniref:adenosine receptor A3-like n=1 Tax=Ptychodera flava TaxID=63121 RepID=UPI00396A99C4